MEIRSILSLIIWLPGLLAQVCHLPTPSPPPVFNVTEDTNIDTRILSLAYEPKKANIELSTIGGNLGSIYRDKFVLTVTAPGQLEIRTAKSLFLPNYPQTVTQAYLPVEILCNGQRYPIAVLRVINVNDYSPWFYGVPYSISIKESAPVGTNIETPILAIDWDPATYYTVKFDIVGGNDDKYFELQESGALHNPQSLPNEFNGQYTSEQLPKVLRLKLLKALDYDYGNRDFLLNISVTDKGGSDSLIERTNFTSLTVFVEDSDDRNPTFTQTYYTGKVSLDAQVGTFVQMDYDIVAMDGDPGLQTSVLYSIVPDPSIPYFDVNATNGAIFLKKPFPADLSQLSFNLVLKAVQSDDSERSTTAHVNIDLVPFNSNDPVFEPCNYNVSIPENSLPGTQVVQLRAVDPDAGKLGEFIFDLINSSDAAVFSLNEKTGLLTVVDSLPLDRERQSVLKLQARVRPMIESNATKAPPPQCSLADIRVHLSDENDNSPVFSKDFYQFVISDTLEKNSIIGLVTATDTDAGANGRITYGSIEQDDQSDIGGVTFRGEPISNGSLAFILTYQVVGRPKFMPKYQLRLEASDNDPVAPRTSRTKIEVVVLFTNAHVPVFTQSLYETTVVENLEIGTRVIQIVATDPDEGEGGQFSYILDQTFGAFSIDPSNGWISVLSSELLDREKTDKFIMTVGTNQQLNTTDHTQEGPTNASVVIKVIDLNDNGPMFVDKNGNVTNNYQFFIENTFQLHTLIGRVVAQDADVGDAGRVAYLPITIPEFFELAEDGAITFEKPFPARPESSYILVVEAHDQPPNDQDQRRAVARVTINVTQTDGLVPQFSNLPNKIAISESFPSGSLVFTLTVSDFQTSELEFEIIKGDPNNSFVVRDGSLYVKSKLDAEIETEYNLVIKVKSGQGAFSNETLTIGIEDSNDNIPTFEKEKYEFYLQTFNAGDLIGRVSANDNDISNPNNQIDYEMERAAIGIFQIDQKSGELFVGQLLRPENFKKYSFSVTGRDRGSPSLRSYAFVTVHMDSAPSVPKFPQVQYAVEVVENSNPAPILELIATHPTGPVTYTLKPENSLFDIGFDSGVIKMLKSPDFETEPDYKLEVSGCYKENSKNYCARVPVLITIQDVNDNAPIFEQKVYTALIPSDFGIGSEVLRVRATDADSGSLGQLSYAMRTATGQFTIDYSSGAILSAGNLQIGIHNLTVEAFDHGTPTQRGLTQVVITVNGTNAHAPEFEYFAYEVNMPEDVKPGTLVMQLTAIDPDPGLEGKIIYRFAQDERTQSLKDKFSLNSETGRLETAVEFDYDTEDKYQLVIEAADSSDIFARTGSTVIKMQLTDVNDHKPIFHPLPNTIYISTSRSPGSIIVTAQATDGDGAGPNSKIEFILIPEDSVYFEMRSNVLIVKKQLVEGRFPLDIIARDYGEPPLSSTHHMEIVVMADKDKYPIFPELSYLLKIVRNATLPKILHKFEAKVKSGRVRFGFLLPRESITGLDLNEDTGELTATTEFTEALKKQNILFFVIRAVNSENLGYFSDVMVELSIVEYNGRDIPLLFPTPLFRTMIWENTPVGTPMNFTVEVVEPEQFGSKLRYWLSPNDTFGIDNNGALFTRKEIDIESLTKDTNGVYSLRVFATNGLVTTHSNLQIKVQDVNEFSPKFDKSVYSAVIPENVSPGDFLIEVSALDEDFTEGKKLEYKIKQSSVADQAAIDSDGIVTKSDGPSFDLEGNGSIISFTIQAFDKEGNTAEAQIELHLEDSNDNKPLFENLPFIWNVTEGPNGLKEVFKISATDADQGVNSEIEFQILQGNALGLFLLQNTAKNEAELSVIRELNRESRSIRILTIEARDLGEPSLFSIATVEVNIIDTNDNAPKFYRNLYKQQVPVDFPIGFSIMTVFADDQDVQSKIEYSIENDKSGLFEMDSTEGVIKLKRSPPRQNATHNFMVKAHDGQFEDRTNVSITIYRPKNDTDSGEEVNRPPVFGQKSYNFNVTEGKTNVKVGQIVVEDPDEKGALLGLWVEPPEYRRYFRVDNATGTLYTSQAFDYSDRSSYNFLVVAHDKSVPALTSFVQVKIEITDTNDHFPEFDKPDYSGIVPPNAKPPYPIPLGIDAIDGDAGLNAKILYSIEGDDKSCFEINSETAHVQLICQPDFYNKKMYIFEVLATDQEGAGHTTKTNVTVLVSPPDTTDPPIIIPPVTSKTTPRSTTQLACRPRFSKTKEELTLVDNTPPKASIYLAVAKVSDAVECDLQYDLEGKASDYFTLDSHNGMLKLAKPVDVDQMEKEGLFNSRLGVHTFELSVTAKAQQTDEMALLKLVVRILRRDTEASGLGVRFEEPVYRFSVEEEQPSGSVFGVVKALPSNQSTNGAPIVYTVLFNHLFKTNSQTVGQLETTQTLDADGANPREYSFVVQASDGQNSDYVSVMVSVIDLNDHSPEFNQLSYSLLIPEGPYGSGAVIGRRIQAKDGDSGQNALLTYSLKGAQGYPFQIEPESGRVRVYGVIDREVQDIYSFFIVASDSGDPPRTTEVPVNVTVLDVNDNSPEFMDTPQIISVKEKGPEQQILTQIKAIDNDVGENGRVLYRLTNHEDLFHVSSEDGELKTLKPLLLAQAEQYQLQIVARDLGRPPRYAVMNLTIEVIAESQDKPSFKQEIYYTEVLPSLTPGHTIIQVSAGVGPLIYTLKDDVSDLFEIGDKSGMLTISRQPTPTEVGVGHTLKVIAINESSNDQATTTVRVYMVSDSDGGEDKIFSQSQYWISVMENEPGRTFLIDLNSSYEIRNRPVKYSFVKMDYTDLFEIESNTGKLFAIQPLDREKRSLYFLKIKANLNSSKAKRQLQVNVIGLSELTSVKTNEVLVTVNVTDKNDNDPVFEVGPFGVIFTTRPNVQAGQEIGKITAKDPDKNSWIRYSIDETENDDNEQFRIDSETGVVLSAKSFVSDQDTFHFTVVATDGLHTVRQTVKVYKLTEHYQAILVSKLKPKDINVYQLWTLERKLSQLTGWNVSVNGISPHTEEGVVNTNLTDIRVHGVDPKTGKPVDGDVLVTNLQQVFPDIQQDLVVLRLISVTKPPIIDTLPLFSTAEIILIVIAAAIIFVAFIGLCMLLRLWLLKKPEKDKGTTTSDDYMVDSVSSGPRPYDTVTLDRKTANKLLVPQRGPYANAGKSVITKMEKSASPKIFPAYAEPEPTYPMGSSSGSGGSVASRHYPCYDDEDERYVTSFPSNHHHYHSHPRRLPLPELPALYPPSHGSLRPYAR